MKQKRWNAFVFLLMTALVFCLCSCSGGGGGGHHHPLVPGTIELHNHSAAIIDHFYLAPVDQTSWGPNILDDLLYPDDFILIWDIEPDYYDSKITVTGLYSDYYAYLYDIDINPGQDIVLHVYNSSFTGSLEIHNDTVGAYIIGVYVVPAGAPTWGSDQSTSDIGPSGQLHLSDFDPGLYDVKIVWDVGPDSNYYDVNIESLTLTTLNVN